MRVAPRASYPARVRRRVSALERREHWWFLAFISPWIVGFLAYFLYPVIASLVLSFTRYNIVQPARWIGLDNYRTLLSDPVFWKSMQVTYEYAIVAIPLLMGAGLLLAVLLNVRVAGMRVIRTVFYLPSLIPQVSLALLFVWLLTPEFGLLNYALYMLLHVQGPDWLGDPRWTMPAVWLMSLWGVGSTMVLLLAGLQGVPKELYEASAIDGAGPWRQFRAITIPMISPVLFFLLITGVIGALQTFTNIYVLTGGGPDYATEFYNLYLYQNAFLFHKMGYASAQAWILFLMAIFWTVLLFRSAGRWVYYGGLNL